MVSITLRKPLVCPLSRYFVCHTPQSVADLFKYFHYSDDSVPPLNHLELTRHCCLLDGIDSLDNICQTCNIITFPISRDVAVTIPCFSDMWLQLCQAANISAAPFSFFKQHTKFTSSKMTVTFNNRHDSLIPLQAICWLYTSILNILVQTVCCYFPQTVIFTSLLVSLQFHLCQYSNLCSSFIQFCYP